MSVRYRIELSESEGQELKALLRGGKYAARKLKRAQILRRLMRETVAGRLDDAPAVGRDPRIHDLAP